MPTVLSQSSEAGPHQRSLGHYHSLQLPHPSKPIAHQQTSNLILAPLGPLQALPSASAAQSSSSSLSPPSSTSLVVHSEAHNQLSGLQSRPALIPTTLASSSPKRQQLQLIPTSGSGTSTLGAAPPRSLLLSEYSGSLYSYQSPRTSAGWDSRATSPLYLVPQSEASQVSQALQANQQARHHFYQQLFHSPGAPSAALLLSPALSQVASEAALLDMDPRFLRRQDDPIEELEWVLILTEIIRQASETTGHPRAASRVLYDYVRTIGFSPQWDELSLPGGRSLGSVREAFREFETAGPGVIPRASSKRPLHPDPATQQGRRLAPKPIVEGLPGINVGNLVAPSPTTTGPLGVSQTQHTDTRRRRGRPSNKEKREREIREKELQEREFRQSKDLTGYQPTLMPSTRSTGLPGGPTSRYGEAPRGTIMEVPPSPITAPSTRAGPTSTPRHPSQDASSNGSATSVNKQRKRQKTQSGNSPRPHQTRPRDSDRSGEPTSSGLHGRPPPEPPARTSSTRAPTTTTDADESSKARVRDLWH